MRRLNILAEPRTPTDDDPREWTIRDGDDGLAQIASFATALAEELGDPVVWFEILWPWEVEADDTWDAVTVDIRKIDAWDQADWWIETLPPYAELSEEQRAYLGIGDDDA